MCFTKRNSALSDDVFGWQGDSLARQLHDERRWESDRTLVCEDMNAPSVDVLSPDCKTGREQRCQPTADKQTVNQLGMAGQGPSNSRVPLEMTRPAKPDTGLHGSRSVVTTEDLTDLASTLSNTATENSSATANTTRERRRPSTKVESGHHSAEDIHPDHRPQPEAGASRLRADRNTSPTATGSIAHPSVHDSRVVTEAAVVLLPESSLPQLTAPQRYQQLKHHELSLEQNLAQQHCNTGVSLTEEFPNPNQAVADYREAVEQDLPDFVDAMQEADPDQGASPAQINCLASILQKLYGEAASALQEHVSTATDKLLPRSFRQREHVVEVRLSRLSTSSLRYVNSSSHTHSPRSTSYPLRREPSSDCRGSTTRR